MKRSSQLKRFAQFIARLVSPRATPPTVMPNKPRRFGEAYAPDNQTFLRGFVQSGPSDWMPVFIEVTRIREGMSGRTGVALGRTGLAKDDGSAHFFNNEFIFTVDPTALHTGNLHAVHVAMVADLQVVPRTEA